jgi:uncharacterized membrane protein YidH (DUF202 family)
MKGGGLFVRALLVLVFLALVANLVLYALEGKVLGDERWLEFAIYGAIAVAGLALAGAGIYFTTRSQTQHPRSSTQWMRRAFVVNAVILLLFTVAPWFFYPDVKDSAGVRKAMFDVGVFLFGLGVSTAVFAFAAYRDYLRVASNRGAGGRRRTPTLEESR